jgi:hypothetical protein
LKLPDAGSAVVEDAKVRDYLLNAAHPGNLGKTALFQAFGFQPAAWEAMRDALRKHPVVNEVVGTTRNPHGTKHEVRCSLGTPDGRDPCLTTIWIVETGCPPRLVTAYG